MIKKAQIDIFPWMEIFWELWTLRVSSTDSVLTQYPAGMLFRFCARNLYVSALWIYPFSDVVPEKQNNEQTTVWDSDLQWLPLSKHVQVVLSLFLMSIKLSPRVQVHHYHFHFSDANQTLTGSSTLPSWTLTRWSCQRSTKAGRTWWRTCSRHHQRTQKLSVGISAMSTSSTAWGRSSTSRMWQKNLMGKSLFLFLFIPPTSLNICIWWAMYSEVQTIQKVEF